jgi:integrase
MSKINKYFTITELENFFTTISNPRDKALFGLSYHLGLRVSEVIRLNFLDLQMKENKIFITASKKGISGEHVLSPQVKNLLESYFVIRSENQKALFVSRQGEHLSRFTVFKMFYKYCEIAGIPLEKRHPHTLRHSLAIHLADDGRDISEVQSILRHKSISSTTKYYEISNKRRFEIEKNVFANSRLARF